MTPRITLSTCVAHALAVGKVNTLRQAFQPTRQLDYALNGRGTPRTLPAAPALKSLILAALYGSTQFRIMGSASVYNGENNTQYLTLLTMLIIT